MMLPAAKPFVHGPERAESFVNTRVGGYTVVNVAAGYVVNDTWKLFGRIDNLLNKSYDDPDGFQRPGFGAFVGAKAVF